MPSFMFRRSRTRSFCIFQYIRTKTRAFCSLQPLDNVLDSSQNSKLFDPGYSSISPKSMKKPWGSSSAIPNSILFGSRNQHSLHLNRKGLIWLRDFGSQAAIEPCTSDGLTVDGIASSNWTILDEGENDWKSHAAAIAQSIQVIKKRLQWKKLMVRLDMLSSQLNKPDLWDDPVHAGKISREHGSLMGKMKEVKAFEQELLEHIDMIKLAREEDDAELESVGSHFLSRNR